MMLVEGLRAFLPGSHFLAGQTPTEEFIGRKLEVKFLDVDKDTSRLVVSHRKAVVDTQIHDLNVGSVLKGVVTAVKPYGAFVDIGGMSGLLHISQISCDHISNVDSVRDHPAPFWHLPPPLRGSCWLLSAPAFVFPLFPSSHSRPFRVTPASGPRPPSRHFR